MRGYKKPYRVKKRKSILRNRFFGLGISAVIVLFSIFYFLFFSNIFQIKSIIITGQEKVSEEDIKSLIPRKNILLIDAEDIKKDILDKFPQIADLEIRRGFPDTLNISVAERVALVLWCESEECFLADADGIIFGETSQVEGLIKISGKKDELNKEKIAQILEIQAKFENGLGITATQAFIATNERLNVKTSEGWEIYFNLKGDLNWQITELGLVLEKQITPAKRKNLEYIDLRFSRVYYK